MDCSILIKNVAHNVIIQYGWHHFIKISYQFYEKKLFFFALFGIKNIIWQKQTTIFLPKGSFSDGIVNKKAIEKDTTTTTSKVENQFHEKKN